MNTKYLQIIVLFIVFPVALTAQRDLSTGRSTLFSASGNCILCHTASGGANSTGTGEDVSPPGGWRSTMMANSAKDPFWQATVESEILHLPHLADLIEERCTNCHIPMGHEQARQDNDTPYTISKALRSSFAMDGVSCTLCHQVTDDDFGSVESFSGGYSISPIRVSFGPYEQPLLQPMYNVSGYEPMYSQHMGRSELCATCHTLFTPFVDDNGHIAGEFPEQTPYIEWRSSIYPSLNTQCQTCHMPVIDEALRISSIPPHSPERSPFYQHHFVGGNTTMLGILKTYADELGVTALDEHIDSTTNRTIRQLEQRTVRLSGGALLVDDTLHITCELENLTGHKFPSGFPSRRAWLNVLVRDNGGRVVFESGAIDRSGEIIGIAEPFEVHHLAIDSQHQVQVYESILGDVNGEATVELLRAATYLKDNRIPPMGFPASQLDNDSIGVAGLARFDHDYASGLGRDVTQYRTPINPGDSPFSITVKVFYQSINPAYIRHLAKYSGERIDRMIRYWNDSASRFRVIASAEWSSTIVDVEKNATPVEFHLNAPYPQPASLQYTESINVPLSLSRPTSNVTMVVTDMLGRRVMSRDFDFMPSGSHTPVLDIAELRPGMYMLSVGVENFTRIQTFIIIP